MPAICLLVAYVHACSGCIGGCGRAAAADSLLELNERELILALINRKDSKVIAFRCLGCRNTIISSASAPSTSFLTGT